MPIATAVRDMLAGTVRMQLKQICHDPYANAFLEGDAVGHWQSDFTEMKPVCVHERKWEIDSHCYPIWLGYAYWKTTGDTSIFDELL